MVDIATLEAEALTAERQVQKAVKDQIMQLLPNDPNKPKLNALVERVVADLDDANNLARQVQQASLKQALSFAALLQAIGYGPSGQK